MKSKIIFTLFFFFITFFVLAQNGPVNYKKIDRNHWRNLKKGLRYDRSPEKRDFNQRWEEMIDREGEERDESYYDNAPERSRKGLGKYTERNGSSDGGIYEDGIKNRKPEKPEAEPDPPSSGPGTIPGISGLFQVLLIIGLIFLIVFILYKLLTGNQRKAGKKIKATGEEEDEQQEHVELPKSELELMLEKALRENNFREAVRIYFIFIIKELKEKNWISWEKKKTNQYYLLEMRDRIQYEPFSKSVMLFEIVWYGKRELTSGEYAQVEPFFKELLKSIEKQP